MMVLVSAVRSNSGLLPYSPCPRDVVSQSRKGHIMREISEFTVCEDCYSEVILPGAQKDVELAKRLDSMPVLFPGGFTCQLYSERIRRVWNDAAGRRDIEFLRQKVAERRSKEREVKMKISNLKWQQDQLLMQIGMTQGLGLIDLEVEMGLLTNASWQTQPGMYRLIDDNKIELPHTTPDLSMLARRNRQSGSIQMQNVEIQVQIRFAEEEWRQFWE